MKFDGGYNVMLAGEPSTGIAPYRKPEALYLPLTAGSLDFSLLQVKSGDTVTRGQVLARDPANYSVPLLAPMAGTVNLEYAEGHITLDHLAASEDLAPPPAGNADRRQGLVDLGVWAAIARVDNGRIPDPEHAPNHLIVPLDRFEPHFPGSATLLQEAFDQFASGLDLLHALLEKARVTLIVDQTRTEMISRLRQTAAGQDGWLALFEVPPRYPFDSPALAAQLLALDPGKTWATDVQAVLAARAAIEDGHPYVKRVVSVGGPVALQPAHHLLPTGYPLVDLGLSSGATPIRVIDGGALTGSEIGTSQLGLNATCQALTVLEEQTAREVLAFVQAGFAKQSYSRTFASFFKPLFREKSTTALGGEARPCVFCGFCESVCPAGIIPHLIYRYLDNDRPEDALRVEFEKCIDCGLCSYVCVSKINHLELFRAQRRQAAATAIEG